MTLTLDATRVNGARPDAPATSTTTGPAMIGDHGGPQGAPVRPSATRADRMYGALLAGAGLVVLATFGLSYHGLYEFGRQIVHLPAAGAAVVPVALDLFSLVAMLTAFVTHDAHWRVRAYCWGIVFATVAVSVAANGIYARHVLTTVGDENYVTAAVSMAALPPALAALSLHLLIVARRHLAHRRKVAAQEARRDAEMAEEPQRVRAIVMAFEGKPAATIAEELGVPKRNAERWTQHVRDALAALERSRTDYPDQPAEPPAKAPRRRTTTPTTKG